MPFISKLQHSNPFVPRADLSERLRDVELLLSTINELKIHQSAKKKMLNHALWLVAELSGNFMPRYRSASVLAHLGLPIRRDHIFERQVLVREILGDSPNYESIVARSICCLVTSEEHKLLSTVPEAIRGFDRYSHIEITIYDMLTHVAN
jgi:hypothetical protein